jgi:hypothetical protein
MTKTRSTRMSAAYGALAIATASMASASFPGVAAAQQPQANRVWAECTLNSGEGAIDTITGLLEDMGASSTQLAPSEVAFVVIYSLQENDGQPLTGGGFTGPVICRNTEVAPDVDQVLQTDNIPTTDLLDVENAIILRYGTTNVEKRYCHTVDANTDCFRLR